MLLKLVAKNATNFGHVPVWSHELYYEYTYCVPIKKKTLFEKGRQPLDLLFIGGFVFSDR